MAIQDLNKDAVEKQRAVMRAEPDLNSTRDQIVYELFVQGIISKGEMREYLGFADSQKGALSEATQSDFEKPERITMYPYIRNSGDRRIEYLQKDDKLSARDSLQIVLNLIHTARITKTDLNALHQAITDLNSRERGGEVKI